MYRDAIGAAGGSAPLWESEAAPGGDPRASPEDQLARLTAAAGPLRRAMAAIAERVVTTRAWERLCFARPGDWARERAGLSARQLQELARVHRALVELPALERALVSNAVPWSKLRLVARVATAQDVDDWIERTRAVSTQRLEREVRNRGAASAGPTDPEADDERPTHRVSLRCTPSVREKWGLTRELAERVAGQRLREGEALELVAAEVFSAISIDPAFAAFVDEPPAAARRRTEEDGDAGEASDAPRAPADEPPRALAALAAGLAEADAFELDRRLRLAVRLEQTLDAAIAPLLRQVTSPEYEWCGDYCTLARCAQDRLGISASKARALLRLERAGDVCPELRDAWRAGRLSWVKAQCLLPLLLLDIDGEWRPAWVAWAERVTVRRLAADVERALLLRAGHHQAWQRCKLDPERAQDPIPPGERQLCAPDVDLDATEELRWRLPCDVAGVFFAVRGTLAARLRAARGPTPGRIGDGEVFDAMLDCALVAWTLRDPSARRPDPVIERDGWRCAVPGCTSRRNLHGHHLTFRSAGGSDARENRVTLCAFHHLRCLHAGLLRVRGRAPDALVFELGLRPGATPLVRYRSGDVAME
jgi:hypothetical protein